MPKPRATPWPNPPGSWAARSPCPAAPTWTGPPAAPPPPPGLQAPPSVPTEPPSGPRPARRPASCRRPSSRNRPRTHEQVAEPTGGRSQRRIHPDRNHGGAVDSGNHVRPGLWNLPGRAHLRRTRGRVHEAVARNRFWNARDDAGFCRIGTAPGARHHGSDALGGAAGHGRDRHPHPPAEFDLRIRHRDEFRQPEFYQPKFQLRQLFGPRRRQQRERVPAGRFDAGWVVEHRRPAARYVAARVPFPGQRCAEAQLPGQPGHRAGQSAGGAGSAHRRQGDPVTLSRQQPNLAKRMAAADGAAARRAHDPAGGRRDHHRVQGLGTSPPAHRGRRVRGARKQRGVALIIALILVALATILATKLTFDGFLERRRAVGVLAAEQALHFGFGAEALAADALARDMQNSPQQTTLAAPWAQPTQPLPITPQDDPEGEPIGTLQGALEDMQGRFNLNNLGRIIQGTAAAAGVAAQGPVQDPQPLEQFQRLLAAVGVEPKWAAIARDWIDADDIPGSPDGAEDQVYTSQTPPYRTGNWPMMSPSELMNLPGFGADRYRLIAPYVTALPDATVPINICTASAPVLMSLSEKLMGDYTPQVLAEGRKTGCFPDKNAFMNIVGPQFLAEINGRFGTSSNYFQLTTRVTLGTTEFTLYSLLKRSNGKTTPLLRSFGTP